MQIKVAAIYLGGGLASLRRYRILRTSGSCAWLHLCTRGFSRLVQTGIFFQLAISLASQKRVTLETNRREIWMGKSYFFSSSRKRKQLKKFKISSSRLCIIIYTLSRTPGWKQQVSKSYWNQKTWLAGQVVKVTCQTIPSKLGRMGVPVFNRRGPSRLGQ